MEAIEAIMTRRSIRKYQDREVEDSLITELLRAAMAAPSAGNEQPWHFIVIRDRQTLVEITTFHPYAQMLKQAPAAIMVCADLTLEKYKGYWVQDCAAATENMLIAARALGLGAVWIGLYPNEERVAKLRQLLGIPEHVVPLSLVSIGYPAEDKGPADRYNPKRVHRERW